MHALLLHEQQRRSDDQAGSTATLESEMEGYRQEIRDMKQDELLKEIYCRLRVLENKLTSHPSEDFQNRVIYKKIEGVYMEHYNATDRRRMAESFRPLFIRSTREGIRVNGEIDDNMKDPGYKADMEKQMADNWANYVYDIMHDENTNSLSKIIYITIVLAIIVSVFATIFSTLE